MEDEKIDEKSIEENIAEGMPEDDVPVRNPENIDDFEDGDL